MKHDKDSQGTTVRFCRALQQSHTKPRPSLGRASYNPRLHIPSLPSCQDPLRGGRRGLWRTESLHLMVSYVSSLATPQGKNSATFHPAPLDHGLSVPGLYEYYARNSPDHPVFTYSNTATQHTTDVLYRDAWSAISTIAGIIFDRCNDQHTPTGTGNSKRPVIAVLALAGLSFRYIATRFAHAFVDSLSYIYTLVAIF